MSTSVRLVTRSTSFAVDQLEARQRRAIEVLLQSESPRVAAEQLGIPCSTLGRWLADETFRRAYVELRREAVFAQIELLEGGRTPGEPPGSDAQGAGDDLTVLAPPAGGDSATGICPIDPAEAAACAGSEASPDPEPARLALLDPHASAEPELPDRLGPPISYVRAVKILGEATSSYEVGSVVLAFARKYWQRVVLLGRRRGALCGWLGHGEGIRGAAMSAVLVPLEPPSVFQHVCAKGVVHYGKLPARAIEQRFLESLDHQCAPSVSLVFPIPVGEKTAAVLYCDAGSSPSPPGDISELYQLGFEFSVAFERILRLRKARAAASA